jgi:hypothetical protein
VHRVVSFRDKVRCKWVLSILLVWTSLHVVTSSLFGILEDDYLDLYVVASNGTDSPSIIIITALEYPLVS